MKTLFIIPARGGSKGIPRKNIKLLGGKPLISYSVEVARALADDQDICVSTDDAEIKDIVEQTALKVPFLRPSELATDQATTQDVLLHAIDYFQTKGRHYDRIILLQPTSPFRKINQIQEAINLWEDGLEMVVSVKITDANPYYVLFEENEFGFLEKSKKGFFSRRQDCPLVYQYNGAIYVIDVKSLKSRHIFNFERIKKYVMDAESSIDIDSSLDWKFAEFLLSQKQGS